MNEEYIRKEDALDCCPLVIDKHGEIVGTSAEYDRISELEPVDVRPVVRGKWEVVDWVEYDGHGECVHYPKEGLRCTNCKNVFKKELLWKDNYCPNCGCDMGECEE